MASVRLVTTEMVLTEWLNDFAGRGEPLRTAATSFIERLRADPRVYVAPQSSAQFEEALCLYSSRCDKTWSHTDCASFSLMARGDISAALAYDRHFEQAGFMALLRW